MDKIFVLMLVCLAISTVDAFVTDFGLGCDENLVQNFLKVRDGINGYFTLCPLTQESLDYVEEYLGFSFNSDEHWRRLLCDIEDAKDLEDLESVLSEHLAYPAIDESVVLGILRQMQDMKEDFPDQLGGIIKYQRKVEPWLVKTDFPNSWPIRNTGKKETARLMEKGDETDLNVMTYGAYRSGGKNHYKKWTKAMLSANSLDDYLQVVNKHVMDEPGAVECFAALQDLFRDNAFFGELLPDVAVAFVRMVDAFTEMGLFELVPDYPYYYE